MRSVGSALTPEARTLDVPVERWALCRNVLEVLPDWFGLPDALEQCVRNVGAPPVLAVDDVGFLAMKVHTDTAAEIYVMGLLPGHHGRGIGTALVAEAEDLLRGTGVEYLQDEYGRCLIMGKRL